MPKYAREAVDEVLSMSEHIRMFEIANILFLMFESVWYIIIYEK